MTKIPEELFYSKEHEWVMVEKGNARIGITDYAQDQLGDVVFVEIPAVGEKFEMNNRFAVLESVKAVADAFIPITGIVVEANEALLDNPELLNEDPYGEGWIAVVEVVKEKELTELMDAAGYAKFLEEEA